MKTSSQTRIQTGERILALETVADSSTRRGEKMIFQYEVTVRARPGRIADHRRALEQVAFFPGVTAAGRVDEKADSITIGYNGCASSRATREFGAVLAADGLVADGALWEAGPGSVAGDSARPLSALYCRDTWRGHFQKDDWIVRRNQRRTARVMMFGVDLVRTLP